MYLQTFFLCLSPLSADEIIWRRYFEFTLLRDGKEDLFLYLWYSQIPYMKSGFQYMNLYWCLIQVFSKTLANVSIKGPDSKYFSSPGLNGLFCNCSALLSKAAIDTM